MLSEFQVSEARLRSRRVKVKKMTSLRSQYALSQVAVFMEFTIYVHGPEISYENPLLRN